MHWFQAYNPMNFDKYAYPCNHNCNQSPPPKTFPDSKFKNILTRILRYVDLLLLCGLGVHCQEFRLARVMAWLLSFIRFSFFFF
jgi:hypothetical protein